MGKVQSAPNRKKVLRWREAHRCRRSMELIKWQTVEKRNQSVAARSADAAGDEAVRNENNNILIDIDAVSHQISFAANWCVCAKNGTDWKLQLIFRCAFESISNIGESKSDRWFLAQQRLGT